MRKLVCGMHITMDGFLTGPRNDLSWCGPSATDEVHKSILDMLRGMDTILVGRGGYEEMSQYWPNATGETADLMNSLPKAVFSRTLANADAWPNARVASGDTADEVDQLKRQPGRDMIVFGGARFAQSLARLGLFDEYRLMTHPVALGAGVPLFADLPTPARLEQVSTNTFPGGAILHVYRPA